LGKENFVFINDFISDSNLYLVEPTALEPSLLTMDKQHIQKI